MKIRHIRIKQVDVFTLLPFGGTPSGVVTDADRLSDEEMLLIAREMNVPVTAFVMSPELPEADFRLRFFTTLSELDLSGHATIAAFYGLIEEDRIWARKPKITVLQQTRAGLLPVELLFENGKLDSIVMTQVQPQFKEVEQDAGEFADILGISRRDIIETGLPLELAYTGVWHLIVPVNKLEVFSVIKPDMERLKNINRELGVQSTHLFSLKTVERESTVHTRNFAPAAGISEEPVSGTANGALGCYLVKNGVVEVPTGKVFLMAEQGMEFGRPGRVSIEITVLKEKVTTVRVGGTAVTILDGIIRL